MLDNQCFRDELQKTIQQLKKRDVVLDVIKITELEEQRKTLQVSVQELQQQRNQLSKNIGIAKAKGEDVNTIIAQVNQFNEQLKATEVTLSTVKDQLQAIYLDVPNIPHETVPYGRNEHDNREERRWGDVKTFMFTPKDHVDLGEALDNMDFACATKIAGSRFVILRQQLARLHRALIQFMLDTHTLQHDYQEIYVPYLVNKDSLYGTGQLPKFADDAFFIEGQQYALIPTAEVPLANLVRDEIIDAKQLPLKFTAHTPCFRREAGSYGKDTRGMIRQHQFEKVEMVQIVSPEKSYAALEELVGHAEIILQKLQLPYRVVTLCSGDLGFTAAKTYDIEVWLPSQDAYREISSCSNMEAFQARRMQARWRNPHTKKTELVHTLNGSGLAVGRTLVAIMENYQCEDGSIDIPVILQPYMNNLTKISRTSKY
ncbi:MAG: serine--tRNA ligase [Gammaproteobacteria bacterium]|nr:serine--tRNA ligase [Gammaproteobacteria bacterium]